MNTRIVHLVNGSKHEVLSLSAFVDRIVALSPHLCRAMMQQERCCTADRAITVPQIWALELIAEHGMCPQRHILEKLQLKASTGTVFIDRLCRQGWVRRARNPESRREVLLKITRKGRAVLDESRAQRRRVWMLMFKPLPAAQRRSYIGILEALVKEFSEPKGTA